MTRYIIYGAGAIGSTVGARLIDAGCNVVFIARGEHGRRIATDGLLLETPEFSRTYHAEVATHPRECNITEDDAVLLCMKSQDTFPALDALYGNAPTGLPVVCLQNGVDNERTVLRFFPKTYGALVICAGAYLSPGIVRAYNAPGYGLFDIGCYPSGTDAFTYAFVADFTRAGFSSFEHDDIMAWKYTKLIDGNVGNALAVLFGPKGEPKEIATRTHDEAALAVSAAGLSWIGQEAWDERRRVISQGRVNDAAYPGSSSWQSATRDAGSIESAFLNGEIGLLGRLNGVKTPVNDLLQRCCQEVIEHKLAPGSMTEEQFLSRLHED